MKPSPIRLVLILILINLSYCHAQDLTRGIWAIKSSAIVFGNDTAYLFRNNAAINKIDLSNIVYIFNQNGSYDGRSITNAEYKGTWSKDLLQLNLDGTISNYTVSSETEFTITYPFKLLDETGKTQEALSLISLEYFQDITPQLSVFPSPFINSITVSSTHFKPINATIFLSTLLGQRIYTITRNLEPKSIFSIDSSTFPEGEYILTLTDGSFKKSLRISKFNR